MTADNLPASADDSHLERLWSVGQQQLGAGRYVAARQNLEAAEALAWRRRDALALSKIYLPLLEARRQIRYLAVEGQILITSIADTPGTRRQIDEFLKAPQGTLIAACSNACKFAGSVQYAARRRQTCLESLVLVDYRGERRLASLGDPAFAAGLSAETTRDARNVIKPTDFSELVVPLPPAGVYQGVGATAGLHAVARESLLVAWEALADKWQARHPLAENARPWQEIAWLRLALRIDAAHELIAMRLISVAESVARAGA